MCFRQVVWVSAFPRFRSAPHLANTFDDLDELVDAVAMMASKLDEFAGARCDRTLRRGSGDRDAAAASKLEQTIVAQLTECPEDRISVDVEDSGEVFRRRQPLARHRLPVRNGAADLRGNLLMKLPGILAFDLDAKHGATTY